MKTSDDIHCVKSDCIRSFSGPYFPAMGLNTGKYGQKNSEYGHFLRSASAGSNPVCEYYNNIIIIVYYIIIVIFRVIISIDLIAALGSVGCYILLPACKVEMRVKRQLFWQVGDDVRMRVTPDWCGWVGISGNAEAYFSEESSTLLSSLMSVLLFSPYFLQFVFFFVFAPQVE